MNWQSARGAARQQAKPAIAGSWAGARQRELLFGLIPPLVVLTAITIGPALYLFVTSFTPLDLTRAEQTTLNFSRPLENYMELVRDPYFRNSVMVQAKLSVYTVGLQLLAGVAVALLLNSRGRFLEAIRTVFIVPMVLPPVVVAIIWKVLYTPDTSPIYWLLEAFGIHAGAMITSPHYALWSIIIADVWEWFPFTMLMVLAALQMLPEEPLEAARIDGAGARQLFFYVVLPLLRPTILVAGLFRLIDSVKAFPMIYIVTNGGPGRVTEVTNYYAFVQAFNYSFLGYSSAIAVVMMITVFLLSFMIIKMVGTEVEFE